ncbi:MAG: DUF1801 domain-containing protein [Aggregatilineales bacterium]
MIQQQYIDNPAVQAVFDDYPPSLLNPLLHLRQQIFAVAADIPEVGTLEETLKWEQVSYLTPSKTGTTLRIGIHNADRDEYAIFVHCQSKVIATLKQRYPDTFHYEGNRAIVFSANTLPDESALQDCIGLILTYHRWKHTV